MGARFHITLAGLRVPPHRSNPRAFVKDGALFPWTRVRFGAHRMGASLLPLDEQGRPYPHRLSHWSIPVSGRRARVAERLIERANGIAFSAGEQDIVDTWPRRDAAILLVLVAGFLPLLAWVLNWRLSDAMRTGGPPTLQSTLEYWGFFLAAFAPLAAGPASFIPTLATIVRSDLKSVRIDRDGLTLTGSNGDVQRRVWTEVTEVRRWWWHMVRVTLVDGGACVLPLINGRGFMLDVGEGLRAKQGHPARDGARAMFVTLWLTSQAVLSPFHLFFRLILGEAGTRTRVSARDLVFDAWFVALLFFVLWLACVAAPRVYARLKGTPARD